MRKLEDRHTEFKRAFDEYPSQDNEGYVPDRGGFKCGFMAAWDLLTSVAIQEVSPGSQVAESTAPGSGTVDGTQAATTGQDTFQAQHVVKQTQLKRGPWVDDIFIRFARAEVQGLAAPFDHKDAGVLLGYINRLEGSHTQSENQVTNSAQTGAENERNIEHDIARGKSKSARSALETQCWICPKCYDDHRQDGPCTPKSVDDSAEDWARKQRPQLTLIKHWVSSSEYRDLVRAYKAGQARERTQPGTKVNIYQDDYQGQHMRVLGVVCDKCGHETEVADVTVTERTRQVAPCKYGTPISGECPACAPSEATEMDWHLSPDCQAGKCGHDPAREACPRYFGEVSSQGENKDG